MTQTSTRLTLLLLVGLLGTAVAFADGTETLGPPGILVFPGNGVVGDGTGLQDNQPGVIAFVVPDGALISQAFLYWNGFHSCADDPVAAAADTFPTGRMAAPARRGAMTRVGTLRAKGATCASGGDDTLALRAGGGGFLPITGTLIGGPTRFWGQTYSSVYRADITNKGLVTDGANLIEIQGADFDLANNGASIVVIYDDGSSFNSIEVRDGQDLAYINFNPPLDTTVEQTFFFPPSDMPRTAELTIVAGSVQGPVSGSDPIRPNLIRITIDPAGTSDDRANLLESNQGNEWDHHELTVEIPANQTSLTVQVESADPLDTGLNPASLAWLTAALSVPPENQCNLRVRKSCVVPDGPPNGTDCEGKVVSLMFEYTASGCGASNNPQNGKATCEGGATPADDPVDITVTDKRGDILYAQAIGVPVGGFVTVPTPPLPDGDHLSSEIEIIIGNDIERLRVHTSCSQPLRVGDQFGSMRLRTLVSTEGGEATIDDLPLRSECMVPRPPEPPHCVGGLRNLMLEYDGSGCDSTNNLQGGMASCFGTAGDTEPVRIVCREGNDVLFDSGPVVMLGDSLVLDAQEAGMSRLPDDVDVEIFDADDGLQQQLRIHTSCSEDLDLNDRFGAMSVGGMTLVDGTVIAGFDVEYTYNVFNLSTIPVVNVTVVDDKLGVVPGSPIASMAPDEIVTLFDAANITENTRNVVTVTGELETGEICRPATASARVIVEPDPSPPDICYDAGFGDDDDDDDDDAGGLEAAQLEYVGPSLDGPVTVIFVADSFRNDPVVYDFPDGLMTGEQLALPAENDFTIDAEAHGQDSLGDKTRVYIQGDRETLDTSCEHAFAVGLPAPHPNGDPSPNWFVLRIRK